MNLLFQFPAFLWTLPLAAAPLLFHLFFRIRARQRAFPSLLFFLAADPRLGTRRKLREILVLALRCLALACVLLALSRPMLRGLGGDNPTLLLLVDNSASMAATDATGQSRLDRAIAGATALAGDPACRAALLATTVRDPAAALPDAPSADSRSTRATLASIRPTHARGDPAAAFTRLRNLLGDADGSRCEAHVFTDLQASDWLRAGERPPDLPPAATLFLHDVSRANDSIGTVAIAGVAPPVRPPVAGRPWTLSVDLANAGERPAEATLDVAHADGDPVRQTVRLAARAHAAVPMRVEGRPAGLARVRIAAGGTAAAPGAEAWIGVDVAPIQTVWLAGDERDHGLLSPALSPDGLGALSGIAVRAVPAATLPDALAGSDSPALLSVAPDVFADADAASAIHAWIVAGGTALVLPGPSQAGSAGIDSLPIAFGAVERAEEGAPLAALSPNDRFWQELRGPDGGVSLSGSRAFRWRTVRTPKNGTPLLAVEKNGAPHIVLSRFGLGAGSVYAGGLAFSLDDSTLPRHAAFLAMAQAFVRSAGESPFSVPIPAGHAPAAAEDAPILRFRTVAGGTATWQGDAQTVAPPPRAGLYEMGVVDAPEPDMPRLVAVRGDDSEADPTRADARDIPMFAQRPPRLLRYSSAPATLAAVRAVRTGRSLYGPLLLLAAIAFLAETVIANALPGRKA
ncbi:MAG: BatA domain-containing protein [Kiritimatiellia bacterium]|jgi:hypothetical protein